MSPWVEAFIIIAGIAIVMQMAILAAMYFELRTSLNHFTKIANDLHSRLDPILGRIDHILEDSEDRITSIMGDAAEITRLARSQAQKVDRVFTDAVERLRIQVIRADQILTGTLEVIDEAGSKVRKTLWGPVQQASALIKGLKVGLDYIRGQKRRAESETAPQDEELFI
jgi:hypothetical protein